MVEPHPLLGKTTRTLLVMAAALAVPYANSGLKGLRVLAAPWERAVPDDSREVSASTIAAPPGPGEQTLFASENTPTINNALPASSGDSAAILPNIDADIRASLRRTKIEDASGHALDTFFARLARTDEKHERAVTRILHYGDSTIASDYISGTARRRLQGRFGDAGHGFVLIANPWEWYFHNDVVHGSGGEWKASRLAGPTASDGLYGLGGVSFSSSGGSVAWFGTATRGDFGRHASRFDLYYLEQPDGGEVELSVRGQTAIRFSTRGETKVSRVRSVRVDDGEANLSVRALGRGPVRLFGVALERDQPGVVYDALGSHAAMASYWTRQSRPHWREQIALRDPALIILQYGTNESDLWKLDRDGYARALGELIDELRDVGGTASLLIVAPLDRAERRNGKLATKPVILDLVAVQRREALSHHIAFWNAFEAMGGDGAMGRWSKTRPQLGGEDLTHPTPVGAEIIGDMLSDALMGAFDAWRAPK